MTIEPTSPDRPIKAPRLDKPARHRLRFAIDIVLGLAVFFVLSAVTLGPSAAASLLGIDNAPAILADGSTSVPLFVTNYASVWDQSGMNFKFLMLAAVFSALFALNNAFVRHLRKAHIRSYKKNVRLPRD